MAVVERLEPNRDLQGRWEKRRREWAEKLRPRTLPVEDPDKTLRRRMRIILGVMAVYLLVTAQYFFEMFSIAHVTVSIQTLATFVAASLVPLLVGWRYYQTVQRMARAYLSEKTAFETEAQKSSAAGIVASGHAPLGEAIVREEFRTIVGVDEDGITGLQARWKARQREWAEKIRPRTLPIEDPVKTFTREKRMGIVLIIIVALMISIFGASHHYSVVPQFTSQYAAVEIGLFRLLPILFTSILAFYSLNAIRKIEREYLRELAAYERALSRFPGDSDSRDGQEFNRAMGNESSLE